SALSRSFVAVALAVSAAWPCHAFAEPKTVCTITVNSSDERETLRRNLPSEDFKFVELVERGRPDWLASACRKGVQCDVLLISGHFDGGDEFYSDRLDARESLPVDEMERVSCSDSCPGLFSQLKEVYLFGCNTLNADALRSASAEVVRSFIRSGHSQAEAEQLANILGERHAQSNRERMRQIFKDVPVVYGFSSKAPLGRAAAPLLERYLQSGGVAEVASGRPSARLLSLFASVSMTVTTGSTDSDPGAGYRHDVCQFADDRLSTDRKLGFVHALLGREPGEVRMFLDNLEKYSASVGAATRAEAPVAKALQAIADDRTARARFVDVMRDADQSSVRARMIALAGRLGWLTAAEKRAELVLMMRDRLARGDAGPADVDLVCTLNRDHSLDDTLADVEAGSREARDDAGRAGVLACLGSPAGHVKVLKAMTSPRADDVQIAQVYLRHRPIVDVNELRLVATGVARMKNQEAQIRALDTLAQHRLADQESLDALTHLFPVARSLEVQRAIAGILIRADTQSIARPEVIRALRQNRLKSPEGRDLIDILIRRLQASLPPAA
ncbi:MAG: hypothetical protein ABI533_04110, partial [Betaproteobacteria bacterium]